MVVTAAAALALAGSASAAAPQIAVFVQQASGPPTSYFVVQGAPGATSSAGALGIENLTDQPVTVQLAPVDGLTTSTLGSAYDQAGTTAHGAALWLRLSTSTLQIAPHAETTVAVSVAVPASATAGDYLGGISVLATNQPSTGSSAPQGADAAQEYRYGVGVEVQLPGPRNPHLRFTGATVEREPAGLAFSLLAENDGNVILQNVTGDATITRDGHVVAQQTIAPGTFVSDTSIAMLVRAPQEEPADGTVYRVQAELTYSGGVARLDTLVTFGDIGAATPTSKRAGGSSTGSNGTPAPSARSATPTSSPPAAAAAPPVPVHAHRHSSRRRHRPAAGRRGRAGTDHATGRTTVPGRAGRRLPQISSSRDAFLHALSRAVAVLAKRSVFPALLIAVMLLFFVLQDRIDRRDPKLALAPVHADPRLDFH